MTDHASALARGIASVSVKEQRCKQNQCDRDGEPHDPLFENRARPRKSVKHKRSAKMLRNDYSKAQFRQSM